MADMKRNRYVIKIKGNQCNDWMKLLFAFGIKIHENINKMYKIDFKKQDIFKQNNNNFLLLSNFINSNRAGLLIS